MNLNAIMVDMDGVLVDFARPALAAHGVVLTDLEEYPTEAGWKISAACNTLRERSGLEPLTEHQFWGKFDNHDFWANLPPYPGMYAFIEDIRKTYPKAEICVSTSANTPACAAGKYTWMRKFLPDVAALLCVAPLDKLTRKRGVTPKHTAAGAGSLLIDDSEPMCKNFVTSGGSCILVPRPWNFYKFITDPYPYVMQILRHTKNVNCRMWNCDKQVC